jgi:ribosomal protein S6 kinase alpha-5
MNTSQRKKKYISFLDYINGGELFTHLSQRERFTEQEVQIYVGEIVLALEHLHKVRRFIFGVSFWTVF